MTTEAIIDEIGDAMDEDSSIYFRDGIFYRNYKNEFAVFRDPVPSHFEQASPYFPKLSDAVKWLIADRNK